MISVHQVKSVSATVQYHSEAWEQKDNARENPSGEYAQSEWFGKGAEAAGLSGSVQKQDFENALSGRFEGQQIPGGAGGDDGRRAGLDLTFSPDKSVSVAALVKGDERVIGAHISAVKDAVGMLEEHAVDYRKDGEKQAGDNVTAALFTHETSRANDPQLHTHAVLMNATKDDQGQWRAMSNERVFDSLGAANDTYNRSLERNLNALGYNTERNKENNSVAVAGVSREACNEFSSRREAIADRLEEQGKSIDTASRQERQYANFDTREPKQSLDREELREQWRDRVREQGLEHGVDVPSRRDPVQQKPGPEQVKEGLDVVVRRMNDSRERVEDVAPGRERGSDLRNLAASEAQLKYQVSKYLGQNVKQEDFDRALIGAAKEGKLQAHGDGRFGVVSEDALKERTEQRGQALQGQSHRPSNREISARSAGVQKAFGQQYAEAQKARWDQAKQRSPRLTAQAKAAWQKQQKIKPPTASQKLAAFAWKVRNPGKALTRAVGKMAMNTTLGVANFTAKLGAVLAVAAVKAGVGVAKMAVGAARTYSQDMYRAKQAGAQVSRVAVLKTAVREQWTNRGRMSAAEHNKIDQISVGVRIVGDGQMQKMKNTVANHAWGAIAKMRIAGVSSLAAKQVRFENVAKLSNYRINAAIRRDTALKQGRAGRAAVLQEKARMRDPAAGERAGRQAAFQSYAARGDRYGLRVRVAADLSRDMRQLGRQPGRENQAKVKEIGEMLTKLRSRNVSDKDLSQAVQAWSGQGEKAQASVLRSTSRAREVTSAISSGRLQDLDKRMAGSMRAEVQGMSTAQKAVNPGVQQRAATLERTASMLERGSVSNNQRLEAIKTWTGLDPKQLRSTMQKAMSQQQQGRDQGRQVAGSSHSTSSLQSRAQDERSTADTGKAAAAKLRQAQVDLCRRHEREREHGMSWSR